MVVYHQALSLVAVRKGQEDHRRDKPDPGEGPSLGIMLQAYQAATLALERRWQMDKSVAAGLRHG